MEVVGYGSADPPSPPNASQPGGAAIHSQNGAAPSSARFRYCAERQVE